MITAGYIFWVTVSIPFWILGAKIVQEGIWGVFRLPAKSRVGRVEGAFWAWFGLLLMAIAYWMVA